MKTLWVVGGGVESVPGIQVAKAAGLRVVVSDGDPQAPGFAFADQQVIVSTYDAAHTARLAASVAQKRYRIDGVIAMCVDTPVTVATVAATLGLPGLPVEVAALGADKLAMKERLQAAKIPTAWGCIVDSSTQVRRLLMNRSHDLVLKPVDSRGARGVIRVEAQPSQKTGQRTDAGWAFTRAFAQSPTRRVMVEDWQDGPQLSTEAILCTDGSIASFTLDRNYSRLAEFAPFVIEDGADGPTRLSEADQAAVTAVFMDAARAVVGDTPCTVKGDLVLTPQGPKVIELALRLSGGYMSAALIPRMTGVDLIGAAITLALGEPVTLADVWQRNTRARGVAIRYGIPPGCTCHPERLGHVITEAETRDEAVRLAEEMIAQGEYEGGRRTARVF